MSAGRGRVLIIAGSDSGGGAGIQADIKTVTALGGFAMTAVTAITVQNTLGVFGVHAIPPEVIAGQIRVTLEDLGADAIKIGMLGTAEIVETVAGALDAHARGVPVVLDPVMVAKGGHPLLAPDAVAAVRELLAPRAAIITPNAPEAEALTGHAVRSVEDQIAAGLALCAMGAGAALVKGGHLEGETLCDVLVQRGHEHVYKSRRIQTRATHGTGCTLASGIATGLARGMPLSEAVAHARRYLMEAILRAPGFGAGHGPLGHGWTTLAAQQARADLPQGGESG